MYTTTSGGDKGTPMNSHHLHFEWIPALSAEAPWMFLRSAKDAATRRSSSRCRSRSCSWLYPQLEFPAELWAPAGGAAVWEDDTLARWGWCVCWCTEWRWKEEGREVEVEAQAEGVRLALGGGGDPSREER